MAVKRYSGTAWVTEAGAAAPLPSGMLAPFAGSTAPVGWLLSDGSAVSRTTYSGLFTAIGTAYGTGDGSTTFNLPDLRGRVPAALDNMGGTDAGRLSLANTLGTTAGTQTHTLTSAEMPSHTHVAGYTDGNWKINSNPSGSIGVFINSDPTQGTNLALPSVATGSGGAHNNMQPTILMNYIIKV